LDIGGGNDFDWDEDNPPAIGDIISFAGVSIAANSASSGTLGWLDGQPAIKVGISSGQTNPNDNDRAKILFTLASPVDISDFDRFTLTWVGNADRFNFNIPVTVGGIGDGYVLLRRENTTSPSDFIFAAHNMTGWGATPMIDSNMMLAGFEIYVDGYPTDFFILGFEAAGSTGGRTPDDSILALTFPKSALEGVIVNGVASDSDTADELWLKLETGDGFDVSDYVGFSFEYKATHRGTVWAITTEWNCYTMGFEDLDAASDWTTYTILFADTLDAWDDDAPAPYNPSELLNEFIIFIELDTAEFISIEVRNLQFINQ